jgi:hypothetical protein
MAIFNEDYLLLKEIKLPFFPHLNFQNPHDLNFIVAISNEGDRAAIINLKGEEVLIVEANQNVQLSGHGFFLPLSSDFALSVVTKDTGEGEIHYYNQHGILLRKHSSYGLTPHQVECHRQDLKVAIVANADSLVWFNLLDGSLIKKLNVLKKGETLKHFTQTKEETLYVFGEVYDQKQSFPLLYFSRPAKKDVLESWVNLSSLWNESLHGEILNLFIDSNYERLWMTIPEHGTIIVYNPNTLKIEKVFQRKKASLILLMPKSNKIYVTCDVIENRRYFSRNRLEELPLQTQFFKLDYLGQHISSFKKPLDSI